MLEEQIDRMADEIDLVVLADGEYTPRGSYLLARTIAQRLSELGYCNLKEAVDKLTVIETDMQNKVIDEALRSHYKEAMDAQRVPSDYLLMFTEGGEANAISWASSYQQLQHTKKELLDLMGE